MPNDITVCSEGAIVPVESQQLVAAPQMILDQAIVAAKALQEIIAKKKKPVIFNNEQYVEYEDWQCLARFYGYTVQVRSTNFVEYGTVKGFEATADVLMVSTGNVISSAEAMCLNDEDNWSTRAKYEWREVLNAQGKKVWDETLWNGKGGYVKEKVKTEEVAVPLFQLRSMAQTRACAKAFRNVLAWVVVLAGYRPTPAEEMTGGESRGSNRPQERDEQDQSAPPPQAKGKGRAKVEDVMCSQCQGVNGHTKDCPTIAKKAESTAPAVKRIRVGVMNVQKMETNTNPPRKYIVIEGIYQDGDEEKPIQIYSFHATPMKYADSWKGQLCELEVTEKVKKDGSKFWNFEQILQCANVQYKDNIPVPSGK
jgi:hypothetical protein